MIAWKAVSRYESNVNLGEAALEGCLFPRSLVVAIGPAGAMPEIA